MPKTDAFADEEVRVFLDLLPRHMTYSGMAAACLQQFGESRAWSRSKIGRYWDAFHPSGKGRASRIDFDPEVAEFIDTRIGRFTLNAIVKECQGLFGSERTPSKSSLHRYWKRSRRRKTWGM